MSLAHMQRRAARRLLFVVATGVGSLVVAACGADPDQGGPATTAPLGAEASPGSAEPAAAGARAAGGSDRLAVMEANGDLHEMLQQHQAMMEQMRVDASPQMIRRMETDPMSQMLHSGELIRLMEEHQAQINQMLGKGRSS